MPLTASGQPAVEGEGDPRDLVRFAPQVPVQVRLQVALQTETEVALRFSRQLPVRLSPRVSLIMPLRQARQVAVEIAAQVGLRIAVEFGPVTPSRVTPGTVPGTVLRVTRRASILAAFPAPNRLRFSRLGCPRPTRRRSLAYRPRSGGLTRGKYGLG
jgi:hypothetical protein